MKSSEFQAGQHTEGSIFSKYKPHERISALHMRRKSEVCRKRVINFTACSSFICFSFFPTPPLFFYILFLLISASFFIYFLPFYVLDRYSSVGIATAYGLGGPEIESWWERDFPHPSRPALGPTQAPVKWVPGLSRG